MNIARLSAFIIAMVVVAANVQAATPAEMAADAVKQATVAASTADEAVTAAKVAVGKATAALDAAGKSGDAEAIAKAKNNLNTLQDILKALEMLAQNINGELAIAMDAQTALAEAATDAAKMILAGKAQKAAAHAVKLLDGVAKRKAVVDQYLKDGTLPPISVGRVQIPGSVPTTSTTMAIREVLPLPLRSNPTPVGST